MNNQTEAVINEIEKVIIGKRRVVERVLMAILSEGHILLDDVPGVGKTTCSLRRMLFRLILSDFQFTIKKQEVLIISRVWL